MLSMSQDGKLTNRELGDAIGVSPSMASRIRNGSRLPSVDGLRRISKEFDLPLDTLVLAHGRGAEHFGELMRSTLKLRRGVVGAKDPETQSQDVEARYDSTTGV